MIKKASYFNLENLKPTPNDNHSIDDTPKKSERIISVGPIMV